MPQKMPQASFWTDNPNITLKLQYDLFAGDNVEMYIEGGIGQSDLTFQWIPFQEKVDVVLNPSSGARHIMVRYRKNGVDTSEVTVPIFLNPYVLVNGSSAIVDVYPADIIGLTSLTIKGCAESDAYVKIPYTEKLTCTKADAKVEAIYYLSDGTSITRSALF